MRPHRLVVRMVGERFRPPVALNYGVAVGREAFGYCFDDGGLAGAVTAEECHEGHEGQIFGFQAWEDRAF